MIRYTQWRPDTCDCIFVYEWDDEQSEDHRVHTLKELRHRCTEPLHQTPLPIDLFNMVLMENRLKNSVLTVAQQILPTIQEQHYFWNFDADRLLHVSFTPIPTLTPLQKEELQTVFDVAFSPRRILVR